MFISGKDPWFKTFYYKQMSLFWWNPSEKCKQNIKRWKCSWSKQTFKQFWFLFLSSLLFLAEVCGYFQSSKDLCKYCWFRYSDVQERQSQERFGQQVRKALFLIKKKRMVTVNWDSSNNFLYARLGYQEEKEDVWLCRQMPHGQS